MNNANFEIEGHITECRGGVVRATLPGARIGDLVLVDQTKLAKVGGVLEGAVLLTLLDNPEGLSIGSKVSSTNSQLFCPWSPELLGQCLNAFGSPLTERRFIPTSRIPLKLAERPLISRATLRTPLLTGVPALDRFTPLLKGQRMVITAEPGVGKSSLLWSIAERTAADVVVLALIGERNREAAELMEMTLSARSRAVVVVSTADESPARRSLSAITSFQIAQHHADKGKQVLLLFDSLTRYARALRDDALSTGELPIRRGYPASVFSQMARLLEQAGSFKTGGSITALFSMLTENEEDPMVEEVKGVVDGHIVLRREISEQGIYPALSPSESLSRLEREALSPENHRLLIKIRRLFARLLRDKRLAMFSDNLDDELQFALKHEAALWRLITEKDYSIEQFAAEHLPSEDDPRKL